MVRQVQNASFIDHPILNRVGLSPQIIREAIGYTYSILDAIDDKLTENDEPRLSELLELANLSAVVGNLFRGGIAKSSNGKFQANAPHAYPIL